MVVGVVVVVDADLDVHPYEESIVDDNVRNISNIIARRRRHCGCGCCRCIMIFYLSSLSFVCVCSILSAFAFVSYEEMNDEQQSRIL